MQIIITKTRVTARRLFNRYDHWRSRFGNYTLTSVATTTANITAFGITGNFTVTPSKVYDRITASNVTGRSLNGVISPDDVSLTGALQL